ncbi:MAG: sigma-70 family RNA polymerase sigma factor [Planctomycetota bacterium]
MDDSERFTREWTRAQPIVSSYISTAIRDFNTADDVLQDVAVVLLKRFTEFDPSRSFTGWALGVAKNKILETKRAPGDCLAGDAELLDALAHAHDDLSPELERRTAALRECLAQIKGRALSLLQMRYDRALKPSVIATEMGMNPSAVRAMLSRTRTILYECIQKRITLSEPLLRRDA